MYCLNALFPLHLARENETVKPVDVTGGKRIVRQLLAMGLLDGSELHVMRNRPQQDLVVSHDRLQHRINNHMARHVLVTHVTNKREANENTRQTERK